MSAQTKYFKLGAFVLFAIAAMTAFVIVLGAGTFMRKKILVETYMDESVQGLEVGAPVKFRGVLVGRLEKIEFAAIQYHVQDDRIALHIAFFPETLKGFGGENPIAKLNELIGRGLRVRLTSAGLTGVLYLELDHYDIKANPPPQISWTPHYPYLPSIPSTGTQMMARVEKVLASVEKVQLDVIADKVVGVLDGVDKMVKSLSPAVEDVRKLTGEATVLVRDVRKVVAEDVGAELKSVLAQVREALEKDVAPALKGVQTLSDRLPGTFDKIDGTLDRVSATLRRVDRTLAEDNGSMDEALDNLRVASQDLRELMAQVKRYPSSALFGEAPPKKAVSK